MIDDEEPAEGAAEENADDAAIEFGPTDLEPLLDAWRSTVDSEPPQVVRVTFDERFVLLLERPRSWEPPGWLRRFDLLDLTSEPVVERLALPEGWRSDEIVPGCAYVFLPRRSTLIGTVEPGGTIERAGLRAGDRILAIDAVPVATEDDVRARLAAWLAEKKPLFAKRREVEIEFERAGERLSARVVPATLQTPLGFTAPLGYETGYEDGDVVTPSEVAYVAIEAVRQLAGGMPLAMQARVVPREPEAVPPPPAEPA